MTKTKIYNAIKNSKFACQCYYKDYAFDIEIDGTKYEIGPARWDYWSGFYCFNLVTRRREDFDRFNDKQNEIICKLAA